MLVHPLRRLALRPLTRPVTFTKSFQPVTPIRPLSTLRPQTPLRNLKFPKQQQHQSRNAHTGRTIAVDPSRPALLKKLIYGASIFGGSMFLINALFNGESRQGGIPAYEQEYLNETFTYTALGVGIIGAAAKSLHNMGWSVRLMNMNPWAVLGVGLVGSVGTMLATYYTPPEKVVQKNLLWTAFNVTQGLVLAPMFFYNPAILARAGLYTMGMMGSLSYVAATAKQDKYLYIGGPLLAGVAVVALTGLAPLMLPVGSRVLMGTEAIWLYGGLAVFGGFTLHDVQKVQHHARLAQAGMMKKDPVNEAIGLELDFINIFVRMVQILGNSNNRR